MPEPFGLSLDGELSRSPVVHLAHYGLGAAKLEPAVAVLHANSHLQSLNMGASPTSTSPLVLPCARFLCTVVVALWRVCAAYNRLPDASGLPCKIILSLPNHLRALNLSGNALGESGVRDLLEAMSVGRWSISDVGDEPQCAPTAV